MATSPEIIGESYTEKAEKEKQLTELLSSDQFIDNLAFLGQYTQDTKTVGGFAVYKNGGFKIGNLINCLPSEVPNIILKDESMPLWQNTIHCQNDLDCCQYPVDQHHKQELFMVIHSHPANNTHCLRTSQKDLLAPSLRDLEDWQKEEIINSELIEGILVYEKDCKGLMLFKKSPIKSLKPMWGALGGSEGMAKESMTKFMIASGIILSEIKLDCQQSHYRQQVNRAAHLLI